MRLPFYFEFNIVIYSSVWYNRNCRSVKGWIYMIYATIKHRKEDESAMYPARNFAKVVFYGGSKDCELLNQLIQFVDNHLQQMYQDELVCIKSRKEQIKEETKMAINNKNSMFLLKELFCEERELRSRKDILKRSQKDDSSFRVHMYLNIFALLQFSPNYQLIDEDGTAIRNFQLDIDSADLSDRVELMKKSLIEASNEERQTWRTIYNCEPSMLQVDEDVQ